MTEEANAPLIADLEAVSVNVERLRKAGRHEIAAGYVPPLIGEVMRLQGELVRYRDSRSATACGNPDHPLGPWHPATPVPGSWQWIRSWRYRRNQRRRGCGCNVIRHPAMEAYPHRSGDFIVLGPEVFTDKGARVICWKGVNYVPQQAGTVEGEPAAGALWERAVLERFTRGEPVDLATVRWQVAALLGEFPPGDPSPALTHQEDQ
jgi:hypothetical protein